MFHSKLQLELHRKNIWHAGQHKTMANFKSVAYVHNRCRCKYNGLDFVYDWCVKTRCIDWNMALLHELKKVLLTVLEFQSNPCSRIIQWLAGQSHYQFNNNVQINKSTSTCRGLSLELEHTPEIYKVYLCSQTKIGYAYPCSLLLAPRLSHSPKAYTIQ